MTIVMCYRCDICSRGAYVVLCSAIYTQYSATALSLGAASTLLGPCGLFAMVLITQCGWGFLLLVLPLGLKMSPITASCCLSKHLSVRGVSFLIINVVA